MKTLFDFPESVFNFRKLSQHPSIFLPNALIVFNFDTLAGFMLNAEGLRRVLKLSGMAPRRLELQWSQPQTYDDFSFDERVGLLVSQEMSYAGAPWPHIHRLTTLRRNTQPAK